MSRIGKQAITIPSGVKITVQDTSIFAEGPKGKLSHQLPKGLTVSIEQNNILLKKAEKVENIDALQGLTRTLIYNMVVGVSQGFSKELEIVGVGYRAQTKGNVLTLNLGYSHPIDFNIPQGIQAKVDNNTKIVLSGADKMLLGLVAAKIRAFKAPEPYQGKGIRYAGEVLIRKQGKAAGAK